MALPIEFQNKNHEATVARRGVTHINLNWTSQGKGKGNNFIIYSLVMLLIGFMTLYNNNCSFASWESEAVEALS